MAAGTVDVEALAAPLHAAIDAIGDGHRMAGVVPFLASHRAETAVKVALAALVNEGVAADEAGDDVVLSG